MKEKQKTNAGLIAFLVLIVIVCFIILLVIGPAVAMIDGVDLNPGEGFKMVGIAVCLLVPAAIVSLAWTLFADWINRPS